jgi:GNAT superfamily N-acetyltransferase
VAVDLVELTAETTPSVISAVRLAPGQERFVTSVADSLDEAARHPEGNPWCRAVHADGRPVGFVMLSWDVEPQPPSINGPWFLWKLIIDHRHQGRGHGREVVQRVAEIVREQGGTELLTSHVVGDGGPAGFYERLGFVPRGDLDPDGEVVLRLDLTR